MKQPAFVFLLCSERSGSNLITRILGSHPRVCSPSPAHLVRLLCENRMRYGDLGVDRNWHALIDDTVALFETKLGTWRTQLRVDEMRSQAPQRSLGALLRHVFSREAAACGKGVLFIKENHLYRYLPFLLTAFPDLRIIYQVRDPRDMALSWKRSAALRGCVHRAARTWKTDQENGIAALGQLEEANKILCLKYEDLVADPSSLLPSVCEFVGVDADPAMLDYHKAEDTRQDARRTADWKNIASPVIRDNFGKFRDGLSRDEIAFIERTCATEMAFFGYRSEMDNGTDPDLEARIKALESWDKPAYADVGQDERRIRAQRAQVIERIRARPLQGMLGRA